MSKYLEIPNETAIIKLVQENPKKDFNLLDIGCNTGYNIQRIHEIFPEATYYGCDIDQEAIESARQKAIGSKNIFYTICDLDSDFPLDYWNPFKNKKCDFVLCLDVLEHLKDPYSLLRKIRTYLHKDSTIIANIPNILHYSVLKQMIVEGEFKYTETGLLDNTHIRFFTPSSIYELFKSCDYYNISVYPLIANPGYIPPDDDFVNSLKEIRKKYAPEAFLDYNEFNYFTIMITAKPFFGF